MCAGQTRETKVKAGRPLMRLLWRPKRKLRESVLRENREVDAFRSCFRSTVDKTFLYGLVLEK